MHRSFHHRVTHSCVVVARCVEGPELCPLSPYPILDADVDREGQGDRVQHREENAFVGTVITPKRQRIPIVEEDPQVYPVSPPAPFLEMFDGTLGAGRDLAETPEPEASRSRTQCACGARTRSMDIMRSALRARCS